VITAEQILDLLTMLRAGGFLIDIERETRISALLVYWTAQGELGDAPQRLRYALSCLVATSRVEEREFDRLFNLWFRGVEDSRAARAAVPTEQPKREMAEPQALGGQKRGWLWLSAAVIGVVFAAVTLSWIAMHWPAAGLGIAQGPTSTEPEPNKQQQPSQIDARATVQMLVDIVRQAVTTENLLILSLLMLGGGTVATIVYSRPPIARLRRHGAAGQARLNLTTGTAPYSERALRGARFRALRSAELPEFRLLDLDRTIDETIRSGGLFQPVYSPRRGSV
jgi:uncharacterized protein with von Willebrand factor type A (vWA) domain